MNDVKNIFNLFLNKRFSWCLKFGLANPRVGLKTQTSFSSFLIVLLTAGSAPAVMALPVSVYQEFKHEYTYIPFCTSFDQFDACTSNTDPVKIPSTTVTNSQLRNKTRLDPSVPPAGTDEAYAEFEIDVENGGTVKTKSILRAVSDYTDKGDHFDYVTSFKASTLNSIEFRDDVSTDDPLGKIFRFQTVVTGMFGSSRDFTESGFGGLYPSGDDPAAEFDHKVAVAGILNAADSVNKSKQFTDTGGEQEPLQYDTFDVKLPYTFLDIVLPDSGQTVFSFIFEESLSFEFNGLDSAAWAVDMENDLKNTIRTYASVFDANGNLLPNARVVSNSGFSYAPLPAFAGNGGSNGDVPVPTPASLLLAGLVGLWFSRRFARE